MKSQYEDTNINNNELDYYKVPNLPMNSDDTFEIIESKYHQRPDKLAAELYGTEDLYFVFMLANMDIIEDPIFDFVKGLEIRIPSKTNVRRMGN